MKKSKTVPVTATLRREASGSISALAVVIASPRAGSTLIQHKA